MRGRSRVACVGVGSTGLDPTLGAILPLVGVALGAVLALAWNVGLKRRDEKRERRAVAHLLEDELTAAGRRIEAIVAIADDLDRWDLLTDWSPPVDAWKDHGLIFATHVAREDLSSLRLAYTSLAVLPDIVRRSQDASEKRRAADDVLDTLHRAREVCRKYGE